MTEMYTTQTKPTKHTFGSILEHLSTTQRKDLKDIITSDGYDYKMAELDAIADLKELCKVIKENFGIEPKDSKKMITDYVKSAFDENEAKVNAYNELYRGVMNE